MPLLLLVGIFYVNFTSRVILAPLLPIIEGDLGLGHAGAGSLFLLTALGYCSGLFGSGFVTSRLNHRRTILLSAGVMGLAMLAISRTFSVIAMDLALIIAGLSAGFYLPSGIAILTDLFRREDWGRALAIHELAPNLGFITAPLLAEAFLRLFSWRGILGLFGGWSMLMGLIFLLFGRGGDQKGTPPHLKAMQQIVTLPFFWVMGGLFAVGVGASLGIYTMMPLFLVSEIGMEREWANTLIGFSRVAGVVMLFLSGWITDRVGHKRAMVSFLTTTGVLTFLLGSLHGPAITPTMVFLQAISAVCMFPIGFTMVSTMFAPSLRNLAVSLVVLTGFLVGGGGNPFGNWIFGGDVLLFVELLCFGDLNVRDGDCAS